MTKKLGLTVLIVLATLTLAACAPRAPRTTSRPLSPEEGAAYAAEVDEIIENMLVGFSQNDYATFTRDWTPAWRETYDESTFHQHYDETIRAYGAYLSKTLDHVADRGSYRIVMYHVVFEHAPDVTMEVFFCIDKPEHLVNGFGWEIR